MRNELTTETQLTKVATINGHTAQARYYAEKFETLADGETWKQAGWIKLTSPVKVSTGLIFSHPVKPVYVQKNGHRVVIIKGLGNKVTIHSVNAWNDIKATETDAQGAQ